MPSALEKLVKILRLEQEQGNKNTAVIGGLKRFADTWVQEGHEQARKPEHHTLVDELHRLIAEYEAIKDRTERRRAVQFMLDRITNRVPPRADMASPQRQEPAQEAPPGDLPSADADDESEDDDGEYDLPLPAARPVRTASRHVRDAHRAVRRPSLEEALEVLREFDHDVTALHRVGKSMAEKLARLGVNTIGDLLFFFPRRYDDYTRMKPINRLVPGEVVTLIGTVQKVTVRPLSGGRNLTEATVSDGSGRITLRWFNQPWLRNKLKRGTQITVWGKVDLYLGRPTVTNPEWELLERDNLFGGSIAPVYPLTKGITSRTMRRMMQQTLGKWAERIPDYMPVGTLERTELCDLGWALEQIHFPDSWENLDEARTRLVFDELLLLQMGVLAHRRDWQAVQGVPLAVDDAWLDAFLGALPYELTGAQRRALDEILADMAQGVPMNRLLQGDVGSGKTVVAAAAMAVAVANGAQTALMAPTGILAEQHFRGVSRLLAAGPVGDKINVHLLTGATPAETRNMIYSGLADGSLNVVIGTHALIQSGLEFKNLGLAVIDEQHRFGVEQRGALRGKGTNPHLLVMTATPIPRTLALTLYADLDLSVIDEMPPGRTPIDTKVLMPAERERAFAFVRHEIKKGRQAFVIYPYVESVEDEETEDAGKAEMSAVQRAEFLQKEVFPDLRVGLLHGQLRPDEKDAVMGQFAAGDIDILVATSVVEVGIDVPNASVMLIEGAERFGLAQLHQFRGRVGRGAYASYCLLLAGEQLTPDAVERLRAMEATTDGFKLAEIDWRMRGPGDLLGTRQAGTGVLHLVEL
ncbi:MAG: ATP-dependent DNA helicase RecG, partial [Anaerolineae bacterium]|nr:ATP-dependent DNA helicase RecG [Anaerolineae bacterium]